MKFNLPFLGKQIQIVNRFEGAHSSPKRSNLPVNTRPARFDVTKASRNRLAEKADYFVKNSPVVSGIAWRMATLAIGTGITPNPISSSEKWNVRAERYWRTFSRRPDISSRATYGQLQKLWYIRKFITGESFRSHTSRDSRPLIQTFDAKEICGEAGGNFRADEGDGIVFDSVGHAAAYRVAYEKASDGKVNRSGQFVTIQDEFMVHDFDLIMPGQKRGVTILHPAINTAHNIDDILVLEQDALKHLNVIALAAVPSTKPVTRELMLLIVS